VLSSFAKGLNNVQVPLPLNLWHMIGCHELLASMAFDLLGVGKNEVMLRSGGVNSRRVLQCAVVALNTLTGKYFDLVKIKLGSGIHPLLQLIAPQTANSISTPCRWARNRQY
jgi:hypothetical protein